MNACEGSLNFYIQLCPQNFYSNNRFQMSNSKYFCRILALLNRAIKFLEDSKTAGLFFLLRPIHKVFLSDSSWKMILEILSSSSKNLVNCYAQEHLRFEFQTSTIIPPHPGPPVIPSILLHRASSLARWAARAAAPPLLAAGWPPWPEAAAPRRPLASPSSL